MGAGYQRLRVGVGSVVGGGGGSGTKGKRKRENYASIEKPLPTSNKDKGPPWFQGELVLVES